MVINNRHYLKHYHLIRGLEHVLFSHEMDLSQGKGQTVRIIHSFVLQFGMIRTEEQARSMKATRTQMLKELVFGLHLELCIIRR